MTNNKFEELCNEAITSENENSSSKKDTSNPYFLNKELLDKGHDFDVTGVYFHYNENYQTYGVENPENFEVKDNIYLKVSRNQDKKLKIIFTCCIKKNSKYIKRNSFKIDFLLNTGDEKEIKALNKKVSYSGGKNGNPASEGTYVNFVDDLLSQIIDNNCLNVFKELDFEFPEVNDEDDSEEFEVNEVEKQIEERRSPTLTEEEKKEALNVETIIKEKGIIAYLDSIVDKFHIGNHKNIYRKHIGGFNIIRGKGSYFISTTATSGEGKSLEDEIAILKLIPTEYIFKKIK